jgi:dienelactone hydrolase
MRRRFPEPAKLKGKYLIAAFIIALATITSPLSLRPSEAWAQEDCSAIANQLKALQAEQTRLKQNMEKPGDTAQLKDLASEILAKQRELHKCTGPVMCHGMRDCTAEEYNTPPPVIVDFPGPNSMTLRGFLYVPGVSTNAQLNTVTKKYPALVFNHGSEKDPVPYRQLARFYLEHGFVFFSPHRHGQGLSKDAGLYFGDLEKAGHFGAVSVALHETYNKDVIAALNWLKAQPYVDRDRVVVSGGSYGGIQALLTAEKDPGVRAYVAFTPGTESWGNDLLRERLISAVRKEKAPMFVIQATGDYSVAPVIALGPVLAMKGDPKKWKAQLYPRFGCDNQDAHGRFATWCDGIAIWKPDVLAFLDEWVK